MTLYMDYKLAWVDESHFVVDYNSEACLMRADVNLPALPFACYHAWGGRQ